jgi:hypothetical protein
LPLKTPPFGVLARNCTMKKTPQQQEYPEDASQIQIRSRVGISHGRALI